MKKHNSTFKNISPEELPERTLENLQPDTEDPAPKIPVLKEHGVVCHHWITDLYYDIKDTNERLLDPAKQAIFQYLRHKAYFQQKGRTYEESEEHYTEVLKMAKEMGVFE
jgi:hypothetical protein